MNRRRVWTVAVVLLISSACVTTSALQTYSRADIDTANAKRRSDSVKEAMALDRCEAPLPSEAFTVAARCDDGGSARIRFEDGRTFTVTCAALASFARLSIVDATDGARAVSLVPLTQGSAVALCGGSLRKFTPEKTGQQLVPMTEACDTPDAEARRVGGAIEMTALRLTVIDRGAVVVPVNAQHQTLAPKCADVQREAAE